MHSLSSQKSEAQHVNSHEKPHVITSSLIDKRRILRERYRELRAEIFPECWSVDVDNWSRKRYCPICKSSLSGTSNCFKNHSQDFHDDWANLIQPWVRWKGLRNKNNINYE